MEKKEITKNILLGILISGVVVISAASPYAGQAITKDLIKLIRYKINNKKRRKIFYNTFYRLKNQGFINMEYSGKQLHISLTKEGREKAGKYQIDNLEIKKPRKWDKKWRVLMFDIKDKQKIKREALRGKLKELGFFQLQKSVWICPYDFTKEVDIMKSFFNFKEGEIVVITAIEIDNDSRARIFFNLK